MQIALILLKMVQFTLLQQQEGEGKQNGSTGYHSHQTNKAIIFMNYFHLQLKSEWKPGQHTQFILSMVNLTGHSRSGWWLNLVILRVFLNLDDSVFLYPVLLEL